MLPNQAYLKWKTVILIIIILLPITCTLYSFCELLSINRVLPGHVNQVNDMTLKHCKVSMLLIRLSQEIALNLIASSIGFFPPCLDGKGRMGSMMAHS